MADLPRPPALSRRALLATSAPLALAGCALPTRLPAVPSAQRPQVTVLGLPNERFFPTEHAGQLGLQQEFVAAMQRNMARRGLAPGAAFPELDLLAISGGGEDGAFGAGMLVGWSELGTRPDFFLVTGVSTGALTAPFAFVGSSSDAALRSVYTEITLADILNQRYFTAAIFDDAMADNSPLFRTISRYVNEQMLAEIARGYDSGRLLLIGTTNLDAERPVIWNIGAIAKSGHPRALDTVRRIMLASAAIPGAFAPVLFDVNVAGVPHQELHVDGGVFAQAFLYPASVGDLRRQRIAQRLPTAPARAWIIRNARLEPKGSEVNRRTLGIVGRAVGSMIAASGYNDIIRMYFAAERDRVDYNLAFIRDDFTVPYGLPFDQAYMRPLFEYGRERMLRGDIWVKRPPA
ncbi:patatin-like phospholipase family protein [Sediminicoccus sp. KRV36]|uniref:patatin-like phospholipase family protein n=1 Tax=Sediminicoccus sp. KRV36 TaxID=3133721 RepID=UPI00200F7F48|nr:patatin-like phospholipase family protein [Sediminicoccus rosea]UPY37609.1 patatin-like phospholipase family protein [Sediminicoccus rosea]